MSAVVTTSLLPEPPRRRREEERFHRSVVSFLRAALPYDAFFYHCPMGGQRHSKAAQRLVPLGAKAGIPDLLVHHRGASLYLELKARDGYLSQVQRQTHERLASAGCTVVVCRSPEAVEDALRGFGLVLHGKIAA